MNETEIIRSRLEQYTNERVKEDIKGLFLFEFVQHFVDDCSIGVDAGIIVDKYQNLIKKSFFY
jgi:hypothetical protein